MKQRFTVVRADVSLHKGSDPLSDSVVRWDQLLRETSEADQIKSFQDFIDLPHWFPVATDRIARLS